MGIKYERKFKLNIKGVKSALNDDISITFDDTHIKMPLKDIRNIQKYFPIDKNGTITYLPSNPLIKIIKTGKIYTIYYGNRRLTRLEADYKEHINFKTKIRFEIDHIQKDIKFGDTVKIDKYFMIPDDKRFRINVIGFKNKSGIETNIKIAKKMLMKHYSLERTGTTYRVEFYKKEKFAGMILVKF